MNNWLFHHIFGVHECSKVQVLFDKIVVTNVTVVITKVDCHHERLLF